MKKTRKKRKRNKNLIYECMSQIDAIYYLPSVVMLQSANNGIPGFIEDSQYLPLVASSSLILIS